MSAVYVATVKPASVKDWSLYVRLKITKEGANSGSWRRIDGPWNLRGRDVNNQPPLSGTWDYRGGQMTFSDANKNSVLVLYGVPWNYAGYCQHQDLTGTGNDKFTPANGAAMLLPSDRITWVLGPGLAVPRGLLVLDEIEIVGDWVIYGQGYQPLNPAPYGSRRFIIRSLGIGSSTFGVWKGIGPQDDVAQFLIISVDDGKAAVFNYYGGGTGVPTTPLPIGGSMAGDSMVFETSEAIALDEFEGLANLTQGPGFGAGPITVEGDANLTFQSPKFRGSPIKVFQDGKQTGFGIVLKTGPVIPGVTILTSTEGYLYKHWDVPVQVVKK